MALRAVLEHPKFAHLKTILGEPRAHCLGYLECVWHFCGRFTPQGNIGKYSDAQIEAWLEWTGEPGSLVAALIESRWLDRDLNHRLVVHDWQIHADATTKLALKRSKADFVVPVSIQCRDTVATVSPISIKVLGLPESVPEPEPEPGAVPVAVATKQQQHEPRYEPFEEIDRSELARGAVAELIRDHPMPGNPRMAVDVFEKILANSVEPQAVVDAVKRNHAAYVKFWEEERALNPRFFIPQLHRWFSDGDYMNAPKIRGQPVAIGNRTSYLERRLKEAEAKENASK
jgi:hypothetical protein